MGYGHVNELWLWVITKKRHKGLAEQRFSEKLTNIFHNLPLIYLGNNKRIIKIINFGY